MPRGRAPCGGCARRVAPGAAPNGRRRAPSGELSRAGQPASDRRRGPRPRTGPLRRRDRATRPVILLTFDDVLHIAERVLGEVQVRDAGLLQSAVARPAATVFGEDAYPTLHEKAAA